MKHTLAILFLSLSLTACQVGLSGGPCLDCQSPNLPMGATSVVILGPQLLPASAPLRLSATGNAYFPVINPANGERLFAQTLEIHTDGAGQLVTKENHLLEPSVTLPPNSQELSLSSDGLLTVQLSTQQSVELGHLTRVHFDNPDALATRSDGYLAVTTASGVAQDSVFDSSHPLTAEPSPYRLIFTP